MPKVGAEFEALFDDVGLDAYRALPAVQTFVLPGLGHMGPVESPGRVADAFGLVGPATVTLLAA